MEGSDRAVAPDAPHQRQGGGREDPQETPRVRSSFICAVLRKGQDGVSNGATALNNSNLNKTK